MSKPRSLLGKPLSEREKEVVNLLIAGQCEKEIALTLEIGRSTVHSHLEHIYRKLGVRNRVQAIWQALDRGEARLPASFGD